MGYKCNECGFEYDYSDTIKTIENICPNCRSNNISIPIKKEDLSLFLEEQLKKVEEHISERNYGSDLDEQILLWKLYEVIQFSLEGIRK